MRLAITGVEEEAIGAATGVVSTWRREYAISWNGSEFVVLIFTRRCCGLVFCNRTRLEREKQMVRYLFIERYAGGKHNG